MRYSPTDKDLAKKDSRLKRRVELAIERAGVDNSELRSHLLYWAPNLFESRFTGPDKVDDIEKYSKDNNSLHNIWAAGAYAQLQVELAISDNRDLDPSESEKIREKFESAAIRRKVDYSTPQGEQLENLAKNINTVISVYRAFLEQ